MGYTKYGPFTDGSSPGISASFLNGLENYLHQVSGATETGKYFLAGPLYASSAVVSMYVHTASQGATISSASLDTADQAPAGGITGGVSTGNPSTSGFQIFSLTTTGPNLNGRAGGNWTANF